MNDDAKKRKAPNVAKAPRSKAYKQYKALPPKELKFELEMTKGILRDFLEIYEKFPENDKEHLTRDTVYLDEDLMLKTLVQVDKMKDHYKIFHDGIEIDQLKITGGFCFFLLENKPLLKVSMDGKREISSMGLNERFALYSILSTVRKYRKDENMIDWSFAKNDHNETILKDLKYTLSYRSMSHNSLSLLVSCLGRITFSSAL